MSTARNLQPATSDLIPNKALAGKVALVTGASSGIGKAIAIEMARRGASVVVNYVGQSGAATDVVSAITKDKGVVLPIEADVSRAGEVAAMIAQVVSKLGRLDVLVNNAGIEEESPFRIRPTRSGTG